MYIIVYVFDDRLIAQIRIIKVEVFDREMYMYLYAISESRGFLQMVSNPYIFGKKNVSSQGYAGRLQIISLL